MKKRLLKHKFKTAEHKFVKNYEKKKVYKFTGINGNSIERISPLYIWELNRRQKKRNLSTRTRPTKFRSAKKKLVFTACNLCQAAERKSCGYK